MMVDEYNELIRQQVSASADAEESGISNEMDSKLEQWKERADEYSHKFSALAEGGIGELAGMSGLKNTYNKFTETRKKFKKFTRMVMAVLSSRLTKTLATFSQETRFSKR